MRSPRLALFVVLFLSLASPVFAQLTNAQLVALRSELQNDPQGYGYDPFFDGGEDATLADMLNHVRDGVTPAPAGATGAAIAGIKRTDISATELLEVIDNRDFVTSPSALDVAMFTSLTQQRTLRLINDDGTDTRILGNLRRMLQNPGPQGSRARLNDLSTRNGSRAEQLLGRGVTVTHIDVALARTAQ